MIPPPSTRAAPPPASLPTRPPRPPSSGTPRPSPALGIRAHDRVALAERRRGVRLHAPSDLVRPRHEPLDRFGIGHDGEQDTLLAGIVDPAVAAPGPRDGELLLDLPIVVRWHGARRPDRLERRPARDLHLDDLGAVEGDAVEARPEKGILRMLEDARLDDEPRVRLEGPPGGLYTTHRVDSLPRRVPALPPPLPLL